jgi:hypothetical protein
MRTSNKILILGFALMSIGILFAVAYGSNSTSNMTMDCIRHFYSDTYNEGYKVENLKEFCSK